MNALFDDDLSAKNQRVNIVCHYRVNNTGVIQVREFRLSFSKSLFRLSKNVA